MLQTDKEIAACIQELKFLDVGFKTTPPQYSKFDNMVGFNLNVKTEQQALRLHDFITNECNILVANFGIAKVWNQALLEHYTLRLVCGTVVSKRISQIFKLKPEDFVPHYSQKSSGRILIE